MNTFDCIFLLQEPPIVGFRVESCFYADSTIKYVTQIAPVLLVSLGTGTGD